MADSVQTFDTQGEWETGELRNCVAVDPAGKLSLAPDADQIAQHIVDGGLAVYCRCSEGTGLTAANLGLAGDATLANHSWATRSDGRHYLQNGTATVADHA